MIGPKLFIIYTANFASILRSPWNQYADDTKLFIDPNIGYGTLQNDMQNDNMLGEWCKLWSLPLNKSKCEVLHIGKNNPHLPYYIKDHKLNVVESHLDLGVLINSELSWTDHIFKQVKKANRTAYFIRRSFHKVNYIAMSKAFKIYVRPILEFASTIWHPTTIRDQ